MIVQGLCQRFCLFHISCWNRFQSYLCKNDSELHHVILTSQRDHSKINTKQKYIVLLYNESNKKTAFEFVIIELFFWSSAHMIIKYIKPSLQYTIALRYNRRATDQQLALKTLEHNFQIIVFYSWIISSYFNLQSFNKPKVSYLKRTSK